MTYIEERRIAVTQTRKLQVYESLSEYIPNNYYLIIV